MIVRRVLCFLLLGLSTAACGDDAAIKDCQQPGRDPRRQVEACTRVIAADPKSAKAYNNRCFAHNEMQKYELSIADCNMSIKLDPRDPSAYNNRGVAFEMRGELDPALKDYSKAIALYPEFAVAFANRGDVYAKKGDKTQAIAEYRRALELEPGNDIARNGLKQLGARP
jgi:tetratricopeptide (TPR) repeat protein